MLKHGEKRFVIEKDTLSWFPIKILKKRCNFMVTVISQTFLVKLTILFVPAPIPSSSQPYSFEHRPSCVTRRPQALNDRSIGFFSVITVSNGLNRHEIVCQIKII